MELLSFEELVSAAATFDAGVERTGDIDHFCSSSDWVVPASIELMPGRDSFIYRDGDDWVAMMRGNHDQGWRYLEPLEASWGLACPLLGDDPARVSEQFIELVRSNEREWEVMLLSGLPLGSDLHHMTMRKVSAHYEVMRQATTVRHVASLEGGLDGFLARRSRNFRRSLARADRRARDAGITFERCPAERGESDALFDRILDVERRSWKGKDGVGINLGSFGAFYRVMLRRLVDRSALRTWFARLDGRDIGYVFGGVKGGSYRGLQMSFDAEYRSFALGNLCQLRQIEELCADGFESYDLGTGLEYKHRWAEIVLESDVLIVLKL